MQFGRQHALYWHRATHISSNFLLLCYRLLFWGFRDRTRALPRITLGSAHAYFKRLTERERTRARRRNRQNLKFALTFCFFCILGVGGLVFPWTPVTRCPADGVGAEAGVFISSSVLTPEGRLRFVPAGDVLALGPLELVPCWLCEGCIPGACIPPVAGLPTCGDPGPGSWRLAT